MAALLLLALYLFAGLFVMRMMLPAKSPPLRVWLGASLGMLMMMWLPALLAFLRPFDTATQWMSLLPLLAICALAFAFRDRQPAKGLSTDDRRSMKLLLYTALPLTILSSYLLFTHVLMPRDGVLYTGQATYGDMPLHLSIITSIPGKTLPVDYSILPGVRLAYPFLVNSLSSTFLVLGLSLRWAVILPSILLTALVYAGYLLLALRCVNSRKAAVLAFLLVFINGGLGFLYSVDMLGQNLGSPGNNELQLGQWGQRLSTILNGWYQTPPNHAEFATYNLRWSNLLADLLLPQRTFLAGWSMLLPCLYLLLDQLREEQWKTRQTILLGVIAGGLPLIHTHSFLALALISLGLMINSLLRKQVLWPWLVYAGLAAVLSLPQLFAFTFLQAGGEGFLRFQFNWVNNPGGLGLRDGYLWFYLKNIGLPFVLLLFALFEKNSWYRRLFFGAFLLFLVAEFVLFQPNEYDNNKLFYVWWAVCAMPVAAYAGKLWQRLKGLRARPLMALMAAVLLFASGSLSIAREAVSGYQMFSAEDVALAAFITKETPADSRFVTGTQHINPVSSLAGREVVCGPSLWLYYHGFDTQARQADLASFYQNPGENPGIPLQYGADYVLLGQHERSLGGKSESLDAIYELVYQNPAYRVYRIPEG